MTIAELVALLGVRWKTVVAAIVLAVGAAVAFSVMSTPQYQSSAQLFVSANPTVGSDAYSASLFTGQRASSYAELATSQPVLKQVVKRLHLKESPSQLASHVSATAETDTVLIDVTATADSAIGAQRLARADSQELSSAIQNLESPAIRRQTGVQAKITNPAALSRSAVSPHTTLNIVVAALLGLMVGLGIAVVKQRVAEAAAVRSVVNGSDQSLPTRSLVTPRRGGDDQGSSVPSGTVAKG